MDCKSLKIDRCSACDGVWMDAWELEAAVGLGKGLRGEDPREVTYPRTGTFLELHQIWDMHRNDACTISVPLLREF